MKNLSHGSLKSKVVRHRLSCDACGSSDARMEYEDGGSYCFSCHHHSWWKDKDGFQPLEKQEWDFNPDMNVTKQYLPYCGISEATMRSYGVLTHVGQDGRPVSIEYPFGDECSILRSYTERKFLTLGDSATSELFGKRRFGAASANAVTITEGAKDALSVYEMLGSKYPAVAVRSASSARGDCAKDFDYLNSFDKIYICFDNDEPGRRATREVSELFDVNKVYIVDLTKHKDANDYLSKGDGAEFVRVWWNSKRFQPKGIVSSYAAMEEILKKETQGATATYPYNTLNDITYGIRLGEVNLITAPEGVGKTEFIRSIEYHLLSTTDDNIGIIHLEEPEKRSIQGLVSYELSTPVHLPDAGVSLAEQLAAYKKLTKKDDRLYFYTHFGSDDPDVILDVIRYLAAVNQCKYIFLDHITMIVSGHEGDDERKKLDYISTRLAMLTRELGFTLFLISHVNDDGKTRGSRNISKIADLNIYISRDLEANTKEERNVTHVMVKKNRFGATTGPAGKLWFDDKTFKLSELDEQAMEAKVKLSKAAPF